MAIRKATIEVDTKEVDDLYSGRELTDEQAICLQIAKDYRKSEAVGLPRRYSMADALKLPGPTWMIKDWLCEPTHAMCGARPKRLKSWIEIAENVAIASGNPLFNELEVVRRGPVVVLLGEGGASMFARRVKHVGRAMGLEDKTIEELPVYVNPCGMPIKSAKWGQTLERELTDIKPVKISVDALYSFMGGDVEAGNVYSTGETLDAAVAPAIEAGAIPKFIHHARKSAEGVLDLSDLTQSGAGEWVDSWFLVWNRKDPIDRNEFFLRIEVGSRHWDGEVYDLDVSGVGNVNRDTFEYEGDLKFDLRAAEGENIIKPAKPNNLEEDRLTLNVLGETTINAFSERIDQTYARAQERLSALAAADLAEKTKVGKFVHYHAKSQ